MHWPPIAGMTTEREPGTNSAHSLELPRFTSALPYPVFPPMTPTHVLRYNGEDLYPRVTSAPDAAIKVTVYESVDKRSIATAAGYRTTLTRPPHVTPAPRRGFRGLAYLGNALALRARPTPLRRLAWAWLRGAMVRMWRRSRVPKVATGTCSGGPS